MSRTIFELHVIMTDDRMKTVLPMAKKGQSDWLAQWWIDVYDSRVLSLAARVR